MKEVLKTIILIVLITLIPINVFAKRDVNLHEYNEFDILQSEQELENIIENPQNEDVKEGTNGENSESNVQQTKEVIEQGDVSEPEQTLNEGEDESKIQEVQEEKTEEQSEEIIQQSEGENNQTEESDTGKMSEEESQEESQMQNNEEVQETEQTLKENTDEFQTPDSRDEQNVQQPEQVNPQDDEQEFDPMSKEYILSLVDVVEVDAVLKRDLNMYSDRYLTQYINTVPKGTKVKFLRDSIETYAYIRLEDGTKGWVWYSGLEIQKTDFICKEDMTAEQKNLFANYKEYESKTYYLVWVNIERQKVNVFLGKKGNWNLIKEFTCSSGKDATPSINGEFEYISFTPKIRFPDYYILNFMRYYDTYAIHSVPYKYDDSIYDNRLGEPHSHGCIRVSLEDSNWLYSYIPKGTKIVIN